MGTQYTYRNRRAFQVATLAAAKSAMGETATRGGILRKTVLTAALLAIYGYAPGTAAVNLTIEIPYDLGASSMTNSTVTVNAGGVATGDGTKISGAAYDLVLVNSGGSLALDNATLSNNLDDPTGRNGRTITAKGSGATASLTNSTIVISAQSTNPGADYAHAFTAGVGAADGGHVNITGGSITASGSKRTVGMQANDGGSISANNVQITTNGNFGHAIQAYRTPTADEIATHIELDHVSITTHGANYSVGIQAANKGASVTATDTDITTEGIGSFGVESFNGAAARLSNGSITTGGVGAAGLRVYGGSLGSGTVTVEGTHITTSGAGASGILAGDIAEPTSGIANLSGAIIATAGSNAAGIESAFGSSIASTNSSVSTQGDSSHGIYAHDGGSVTLSGGTVATDGYRSYGLYAKDPGSAISATGALIATNGLYGFGARAEGGGVISLDGGSITTNNPTGRDAQDGDGSRAYALAADGANSSISTKNGTAISTQGQRAYGAYATNGGRVELDGGSVETHGFMAYGVYASGAGSKVTTHNVDISTTGDVGDAVWAYNGGNATINGGIILVGGGPNATAGETANGLVASGGAAGVGNGVINIHGATITTTGIDSVGALAGADIGSLKTSGTINLDNTAITVTGDNATAAMVNYGSALTATNGTKLVSTQGDGIVMTDGATVVLDNTTVEAKGASLVSKLRTSGATQNITITNGSTLAVNNGTLLLVDRNADGQSGNVNLALEADAFTAGNVDDRGATGTGKTNVSNNGAHWAGIILNDGDDVVEDGASKNYADANISGSVASGAGSAITFDNDVVIQDSVSTGVGSSSVFQGAATIDNNLTGQQNSSVVFNGPATIGNAVTGVQGSNFAFSGATTIGSGTGTAIAGEGAKFTFSRTQPTNIQGDVLLTSGSSLGGGTVGTPIQIGGAVAVQNSTLGGNLNVLGTVASSGGIFSPGNSVGTQTFESVGALTDSEYIAEINAAGQSDKIVVTTGNIDIGGVKLTVAQENGNGGYLLNHDYTILETKAGQVINQFSDPTLAGNFDSLAKLDVKYDNPSDVRVGISVDGDKVAAARTEWSANQSATFDGLMSAAGGNTLATAALMAPDVKDALNQLSGEVHASTQSALMNAGGLVVRTLSNRMRGNLGAGMLDGAPTAQAYGATAGSMPRSAAYPLWAQVVGGWNSLDGDGNAAKVKSDMAGLFVGGDTGLGKGWRAGAALGFTDGNIKIDDRDSKSDVRSYTAALYGGNSWAAGAGSVNFLAGAAYTHHEIDSRRNVALGASQTLKADYHANNAQLFTELGYALPVGQASTVEPYLGVAWNQLRAQAFSESGGPAALAGKSQTDSITTFTLGLRGATTIDVGTGTASLSAGLGWRHAAGDVDPNRRLSFIQGNGAAFTVAGAPIARNAAVADLGAEMAIGKNTAMGLAYSGQFGDGSTDNAASLYLKMRFR